MPCHCVWGEEETGVYTNTVPTIRGLSVMVGMWWMWDGDSAKEGLIQRKKRDEESHPAEVPASREDGGRGDPMERGNM